MNSNHTCISTLIAVAVLVIVSSADAKTKSGLNSFTFGNSNAGASGTYSVNVENRTGYSHADLSADGTVKILGKSIKAVTFNAASENNNGKKTATYALGVANYTVDSGSKSATYAWSREKTCTLASASGVFTVGPVPVTVNASVGGGGQVGYSLALSASGIGLTGGGSAWGTGTASGGIGVPLLNLALKSDLQMMKTGLNAGLNVTPTTWSGNTYLSYDPLKIDFSIALMSGSKVWYSYLLGSYAQSSKTVYLVQL